MPCCGSVGGCGAQAVSRKTPIYFIQLSLSESKMVQIRNQVVELPSLLPFHFNRKTLVTFFVPSVKGSQQMSD